MRQLFSDLWLTEPEHPAPDTLPDLVMHAYLLTRETGNVLFCRAEHTADHEHMAALGGLARQYLTHWHEAGPGLARIRQRFGSALACHRLAMPKIREHARIDATFDGREVLADGIEAIPTPGHTAGSTSFVTRSADGRTYAFVGDTIFRSRGSWQAVVFDDGDKDDLLASLRLLREIEPDMVLCGAAVADTPFMEMTPEAWRQALDDAAASLR